MEPRNVREKEKYAEIEEFEEIAEKQRRDFLENGNLVMQNASNERDNGKLRGSEDG